MTEEPRTAWITHRAREFLKENMVEKSDFEKEHNIRDLSNTGEANYLFEVHVGVKGMEETLVETNNKHKTDRELWFLHVGLQGEIKVEAL